MPLNWNVDGHLFIVDRHDYLNELKNGRMDKLIGHHYGFRLIYSWI